MCNCNESGFLSDVYFEEIGVDPGTAVVVANTAYNLGSKIVNGVTSIFGGGDNHGKSLYDSSPNDRPTIYQHESYKGNAVALTEGDYPDLAPYQLDKSPSSAKIPIGFAVHFYTDKNFGGQRVSFTSDTRELPRTINNQARSIQIRRMSGINAPVASKNEPVPPVQTEEAENKKILAGGSMLPMLALGVVAVGSLYMANRKQG
jgi:hypothetical protein